MRPIPENRDRNPDPQDFIGQRRGRDIAGGAGGFRPPPPPPPRNPVPEDRLEEVIRGYHRTHLVIAFLLTVVVGILIQERLSSQTLRYLGLAGFIGLGVYLAVYIYRLFFLLLAIIFAVLYMGSLRFIPLELLNFMGMGVVMIGVGAIWNRATRPFLAAVLRTIGICRKAHVLGILVPSAVGFITLAYLLANDLGIPFHPRERRAREVRTFTSEARPREIQMSPEVIDTVNRWRWAQERKHLPDLMELYAQEFRSKTGKNRMQLQAYYRELFNEAKSISIRHTQCEVEVYGDRSTVTCQQVLQINGYRDQGLLTLKLVRKHGNWLIEYENWAPSQ